MNERKGSRIPGKTRNKAVILELDGFLSKRVTAINNIKKLVYLAGIIVCIVLMYKKGIYLPMILLWGLFAIQLFTLLFKFSFLKKEKIKRYHFLFTIPILILTIYGLILVGYRDKAIEKDDLLSIFGNYISFTGTFCLGYFIYIKEEEKNIQERRKKVKLLIETIDKSNYQLDSILEKSASMNGALKEISVIDYNKDWLECYYEFELLGGDSEVKRTLYDFFKMIDKINEVIRRGEYKEIGCIYNKYFKVDEYSIRKYNYLEMSLSLHSVALDFHDTKQCWDETKENIFQIKKLNEKYYFILESYIYNRMRTYNVDHLSCDINIQIEIVDWLMDNYDEIRKVVKQKKDKRIITKVVIDVSIMLENKSNIIGMAWGEYYIKK